MSAVSFENLFFIILPGHVLYMECPFRHWYGRTYKAQLSSKNRRAQKLFFHLNNRLNALVNKRNLNTFILIFIRNTPVFALKIRKRGWACILERRGMVML